MRATLVMAMLLGAAACRSADSRSANDSTMARDLAMASQPTGTEPELKDTALTAPVKAPVRRPRTQPASPPRDSSPTAAATTPPVPEPALAPTPAPAATPPPFRGIPVGAAFVMVTKSPICTTNLPGDKLTATITADVAGEKGAVIPAGATAVLEVAQVTPGDKPESASITLRIRSVLINDQPVAVPSDVTVTSELERHTMPRDKGSDRNKVIGGVVAGAIIGQILGKNTKSTIAGAVAGGAAGAATAAVTGTKYDACLPLGGTLRAVTREPVPLTPSQ